MLLHPIFHRFRAVADVPYPPVHLLKHIARAVTELLLHDLRRHRRPVVQCLEPGRRIGHPEYPGPNLPLLPAGPPRHAVEDGNRLGSTPLQVKLDNHKAHTFVYKRSGYKDATCTLTKGTGGGWVIFDVITGLVPVIIDAATGNWSQTQGAKCSGNLEPISREVMASEPDSSSVSGPTQSLASIASAPLRTDREELMQNPALRLALNDVMRLHVVAKYDEIRPGLLSVELGDRFSSSPSAGYNVARFYQAYAGASGYARDVRMELWSGGSQIGEYTPSGLILR